MSNDLKKRPICLTIGGSDSCGGAGIQADLRVFEALSVQGCSAITALTAQNHERIHRIEAVSLAQLDAELHAIFDVYDVAAVKTGMLLDAEHIAVISACLGLKHNNKALIVDPVISASSGKALLNSGAVETLKHTLIKQATLFTPNLHEAAIFLGREIGDVEDAAAALVMQLDCAVLLKGGHGKGDVCTDVLCEKGGKITLFSHPKQAWSREMLHGTGCRLASAIAANIAKGASLHDACKSSIAYLQR
ncbi:MAG: bifunctional hydroxymethylpyrimidine kinase/phosphomethylpyrimidine kinase [Proteobacteria bacterium]|nr:MAG: bifunctional hydroxymethylpyrimidine kinase/phosphomethylpyrimidine kinase [Pseudomonadota bacterium]